MITKQDNENLEEAKDNHMEKVSDDNIAKMSATITGRKHTEETKAKISNSLKGEKHHFYGKKHTDETKRKMSLASSGENNHIYGKTLSDERKEQLSMASNKRRYVAQVDVLTGFVIKVYPGVKIAAKAVELKNHISISGVLSGKNKTAAGFFWRDATEDEIEKYL